MSSVAVIGSGSWGTAIARLLCENGHEVSLWSFKQEEIEAIKKDGENKEFLPGVQLPAALNLTSKDEVVTGKEFIIYATPSSYIRETMTRFSPLLQPGQIIVSIAKGLENGSLLRLSQVLEEVVPQCHIATLSGPSHAEEVGKGIPTTCVASSKDEKVAEKVQDLFMSPVFRVYVNRDIVGVELGGALKNVIALSTGIIDGLGFGDNTKAAIMTRGIAEITRLGVAMGADPATFYGLTGIGDLIVTCTSMHSRNRRAGILLGQGKTMEETLEEVHMVVEGIHTAQAVLAMAKKYHVAMPITEEINKVLFERKDPKQAVVDLMTREKTREHATEELFKGVIK